MREIRQRKLAIKVLNGIQNNVKTLLAEQRAKLKEFAEGKGEYAGLEQEALLKRVHKEVGQGAYAILSTALGEFGLKAPDEALMKNLEYVRNNQEALKEVMIEKGAEVWQVKEAISVTNKCFASMEGLWGKTEEVAKILVEGDAKEQQKAQSLMYGGIALATTSAVSVGGTVAALVFTIVTAGTGGMFPLGLFFGGLLLGPMLIVATGLSAAVALHESEMARDSKFTGAEREIANLLDEQANYYAQDTKRLEKVCAQAGEISEKLNGVPQALEAALERTGDVSR